MSKVKNEDAGDEMFNISQTPTDIKNEPEEMEVDIYLLSQEIKEEPEFIIKSELEWSPTKLEDEQQEYLEYQCNKIEPGDEYKLSITQCDSNDSPHELSTTQSYSNEFEEFSCIKYVDENQWDDDDDENDDGDNYDNSNDEDYIEDNTSDEDSENENYIEDSSGSNKNEKSENICRDKLSTRDSVEKYIIRKHPDTKDTSDIPCMKSKTETYECPLCPATYHEFNHMRFHFIDKHPDEYGELFSYPCHLCENTARNFINDQEFFKHLLEEHNLKDWTLMNFDFYPKKSDDPHFICTKCLQIFTELDLLEFLRHYLEHINYYRFCRSCNNKYSLKLINFYHMCHGWFDKFQNRAVKLNKKQRTALSSWQEFEEYIMHTCSFCNKEFENLIAWQTHLKELHHSDTLKGLEMEEIPNEFDRLKCNTCNAFVDNSSLELHTRRFQHLPHEHYKCRHCSRTFANYKLALNHVLKKCQDQDDQTEAATLQEYQQIICPLCDNLWFRNEKDIVEHFIGAHNNFRGYYTKQLNNLMKCNVCQLHLANDDKKCRYHILFHFAQKPYKCLKCAQSFSTVKACDVHIGFHLAKPQKKSENKCLTRSNEQEPNVKTPFGKGSAIKEIAEFISYACPECNDAFENKPLWQEHINEKHDFFQEDNLAIKDPLDGTLKCPQCHLKFGNGSPIRRRRHKLLHMTYKAFICKICNYRGCTLSYMYSHLRSLHFAKASYKCPICSAILTTRNKRIQHLKNTHPHCEWPYEIKPRRTNDSKYKKQRTVLKRPIGLKEFEEFTNYACPECNEYFITQELWREHINKKHEFFKNRNLSVKDSKDGSLKCSHCQVRLVSNIAERQKHKLTHMPFKSFICKLCNYRSNTSAILITHLKATHFVKGSFKCPICPAILKTPYRITEHLKKTHPRSACPGDKKLNYSKNRMQMPLRRSVKIEEFEEFISYACPDCKERFATQELWKEHINEKHDFFQDHNLGIKDSTDGSYKCSHCQLKVSPSVGDRQKHKLTHMPYKAFVCKLCSNRCSSLSSLRNHLRGKHFAKGSYKCPICPVILTTSHEKTEHLENMHHRSEWPELMCRLCCTTYADSSSLGVHMREHEKTQYKNPINIDSYLRENLRFTNEIKCIF